MRTIFSLLLLLIAGNSYAQTGKFYGFVWHPIEKWFVISIDLRHHKIDTINLNEKYRYNWSLSLPSDPKSYTIYLDLLDYADNQKLVGIDVRSGNIICNVPGYWYGGALHYDHDMKKFICTRRDGVYLFDTAAMNAIKIIDLQNIYSFYSSSNTYDPVSKTLILKSIDSTHTSYIWFFDIRNKKVLRKINCDTFAYDYLQYDRRGKRFYCFSGDNQGGEWITTMDSTLSNPKKLLKVSNTLFLWDVSSYFDTEYQRYFFITQHPNEDFYLVAYDVSQNALVDSIRISRWVGNIVYFPDSTRKVKPDVPLDNTVLIYPNPFSNRINFQSRNPVEKIEVFDMMGRRVETFHPTCDYIITSAWKPGVYVAWITVGKDIIPVKLEKVSR